MIIPLSYFPFLHFINSIKLLRHFLFLITQQLSFRLDFTDNIFNPAHLNNIPWLYHYHKTYLMNFYRPHRSYLYSLWCSNCSGMNLYRLLRLDILFCWRRALFWRKECSTICRLGSNRCMLCDCSRYFYRRGWSTE